MELIHITIARVRLSPSPSLGQQTKCAQIWPVTTPFVKTYRLATPLLIFQVALIAGSFLTGFILAPILVLSRHMAQRPARRLRHPEQKTRYRRMLALGFYVGTTIVVGGLIGIWTRWCLGGRDPWIWVVFWLLEGKNRWSRPALLAYWAALGSLSVAGWTRQLARFRRYRTLNSAGEPMFVPGGLMTQDTPEATPTAISGTGSKPPTPSSLLFPGRASTNRTNGAVSSVATDLLDAADKHVPTLKLNARRKFFHALAVVMFVPGIAIDVGTSIVLMTTY